MHLQGGARDQLSNLKKGVNVTFITYVAQLVASILFVVLYVWGTYSAPVAGSWRYGLDAVLSAFFAIDYITRLMVSVVLQFMPEDVACYERPCL